MIDVEDAARRARNALERIEREVELASTRSDPWPRLREVIARERKIHDEAIAELAQAGSDAGP